MSRLIAVVLITALFISSGCTGRKESGAKSSASKPSYAFITNGVANFWNHAKAGVEQAGKDLNVDVTVITPESMTDQTRKIEDLLTRGTDGIAISAIDPANQVEILNK